MVDHPDLVLQADDSAILSFWYAEQPETAASLSGQSTNTASLARSFLTTLLTPEHPFVKGQLLFIARLSGEVKNLSRAVVLNLWVATPLGVVKRLFHRGLHIRYPA